MTDVQPVSHLSETFFKNPKLARQMMTFKQWRETALATNGYIIANGETYSLHAKSRGGGMYEVKAELPCR